MDGDALWSLGLDVLEHARHISGGCQEEAEDERWVAAFAANVEARIDTPDSDPALGIPRGERPPNAPERCVNSGTWDAAALLPPPSTSPPVLADGASWSVQTLSLSACLQLLRDFLLAHTLKDCSVLVNVVHQPSETSDPLSLSAASHPFEVSDSRRPAPLRLFVSVVDLQLKDAHRIPYYARLDREVVQAYVRARGS